MTDAFEIIYAAHTATCTFLLDSEGICRRIAHIPNSKRNLSGRSRKEDSARAATRCVGAQYVASLDPAVAGMLTEMPRVGAAMLFARVDERGRVSLVRTGTVTRFESYRDDPFLDTGNPSTSVETSAPVIASSTPSPARRSRETLAPPPPDPYQQSSVERTLPLQALRSVDLRHILPEPDDSLDATAEYDSSAQPRTWPSAGINLTPPQPATLRQPTILPVAQDKDEPRDAYGPTTTKAPPPPPPRRSEPPPVPPPRRSEPYRPRMPQVDPHGTVSPLRPRSHTFPQLDKVASRRRGDR